MINMIVDIMAGIPISKITNITANNSPNEKQIKAIPAVLCLK